MHLSVNIMLSWLRNMNRQLVFLGFSYYQTLQFQSQRTNQTPENIKEHSGNNFPVLQVSSGDGPIVSIGQDFIENEFHRLLESFDAFPTHLIDILEDTHLSIQTGAGRGLALVIPNHR